MDDFLSKQVRNDIIKGDEEKLEAHLSKEAVQKVEWEAAEKAEREAVEANAREAAEKVVAEVATREQVEAALAAKAAQKSTRDAEKTTEVALTQWESLTTDLAPLVIKTREEL